MSFTNDVAMNESGYDRVPLDFYPTPAWITEIICDFIGEHFPNYGTGNDGYGSILEPACGEGHMSKVMEARGLKVDSYDLMDRGYGLGGVDFLKNTWNMGHYDGIVTNPPYGDIAKKFIEHGINLIDRTDKFMIMILRNEFDCAKGVTHLFNHPSFYAKIVLTRRPLWIEPKEGEKSGSPRHNYSCFVWTNLLDSPEAEFGPRIHYAHPNDIVGNMLNTYHAEPH